MVTLLLLLLLMNGGAQAASQYNVHLQMPEGFKATYEIMDNKLLLRVDVPMDKFCSVDALASRVGDNHFEIRFIPTLPRIPIPRPQIPEMSATGASKSCTPPGGIKTLAFTLSLDPEYPEVYVKGILAPVTWGSNGAAPAPPKPPVKPANSNIGEFAKVKLLDSMNGKYRFDYTVTLPEGAVLNHITFYCDGQVVFESRDTHGSFQTDSLCTLRAELEHREGGEERKIEGTVFSPSAGKPECLAIDANLFRYRFELSNCEKMYGSSSEQCQELQRKIADLEEKARNMGCGNVQIGVSGQEGCSGAIAGKKTVQAGQWTVHLNAKVPTAITAEGKTLKVTVCPTEMLRNSCQSVTAFMKDEGDDHYKITVRYNLEVPPGQVCAQVMRPPKPRSFTITPRGADVYIEVEKEIGRAPLPIKEELNVEELKKLLENCIKGKCTIPQPKLPEINTKDKESAVPRGLEIAEKLAEQMKHISEHIIVKNVNVKQGGNTIVMQVQAEIQKRLFGLIPVHIPAVVEAEDNHVKTEMPWWGRILSILSW